MPSPKPNEALYEFLKSPESRDMTNVAVAERLGTSESAVRRVKKHISEGRFPGLETEDPIPHPSLQVRITPIEPTEMIPLNALDLDSGTRVRDVDPEAKSRYEDAYRETQDVAIMGPLVAYRVQGFSRPLLVRGFHRHAALRAVFSNEIEVPVVVKEGTFHEALREAMRDNREHGLPLSRQDRIGILVRAFDEGWADWTDVRIGKEVGETDRKLIAEVRRTWYRRKGVQDPGVRLAERNGTEYEMRVPVHPDRGPDQAEADDVDLDGDDTAEPDDGGPPVVGESNDERRHRIDNEYLQAIPCRDRIDPMALAAFDSQAIAYRNGLVDARSRAANWCAHYRPADGEEPSPLYHFWEQVARFPVPIPLPKKDPETGKVVGKLEESWVPCRACKDPETGLSTGHVPGQKGTACPRCRGYAFRIPGY